MNFFGKIGVCALFAAMAVCAQNAAEQDGENTAMKNEKTNDREYVWLSVEGRDIMYSPKSEGGERPFIPVGIGYCRDVIIRNNDEEVMKFCTKRFLNTVRLSFYTRFFNSKASEPIDIQEHIMNFIDPVVEAAKKHNMYVILDAHEYFSSKVNEKLARQEQEAKKWDESGIQKWIDSWKAVAERYKDEPNVLGYELCNEPHDITPEQAREWYTRCLKEIRKIDKRHIILLGNYNWSHSRSLSKTWDNFAQTVDAPYNNVVFAFHDYPNDNHPWAVQRFITEFRDKNNVPVLCTEFGATWWEYDETTCRQFQAGMLSLFAKENVGWMIWALKRLRDNPRNPHPKNRTEEETDEAYKARIKAYNKDAYKADESSWDSCAYSDIWGPVARIMGSKFPKPAGK